MSPPDGSSDCQGRARDHPAGAKAGPPETPFRPDALAARIRALADQAGGHGDRDSSHNGGDGGRGDRDSVHGDRDRVQGDQNGRGEQHSGRGDRDSVQGDQNGRGEQDSGRGDRDSRRVIVGIVGPPGAGKSSIAAALTAELGPDAVAVPMDGFHLSNAVLRSLGRQARKGAPDTFDVDGYLALLERLRRDDGRTVYAPGFDRERDEPVAGDLAVPPSARIVITEGNYLLLPDPGWNQIRPLLDQVWYVDVDQALRLRRLIGRHARFGKDEAAARAWATGPDEANARLIAATRDRADLAIQY